MNESQGKKKLVLQKSTLRRLNDPGNVSNGAPGVTLHEPIPTCSSSGGELGTFCINGAK